MGSTFTPEQVDKLEVYLQAIEGSSDQGAAVEAYRYLLDIISIRDSSGHLRPKLGIPEASWIWINGAIDVNSGASGFGQFIRNYTLKQAELRGLTVDVNSASNAVAAAVLGDIIRQQDIPPVADIGRWDASAATADTFGGNTAAWSGNLLFLVLGEDEFAIANLINSPDAGYDIAASLKAFVMATGESYNTLPALAKGIHDIWTTVASVGSVLGTAATIGDVLDRMQAKLTDVYGFSHDWILSILGGDIGTEQSDDNGVENGPYIHMGNGDDLYSAVDESSVIDGGRGNDTIDIGYVTTQATLDVYSPDTNGKGIRVQKSENTVDHIYNFEVLKLGAGDDTVRIHGAIQHGSEKPLLIDALDGNDELAAIGAEGPVVIDAEAGRVSDQNGFISIQGFERFVGSAFNDTLQGSDGDYTLDGGAGNDLLNGTDGNVLMGGAGADHLVAEEGSVTLNGGAGNDYLEATGDGPVTYVFGAGSGRDVLGLMFPYTHSPDTPESWDETWLVKRGNDTILFDGLSASDLTLEWDYTELWDNETGELVGREGYAAIKINDTGDTIYLGYLDLWIGEMYLEGKVDYFIHYGRLCFQEWGPLKADDWDNVFDLNIFQTADGTRYDIMELFDFVGLSNIVQTELPPPDVSTLVGSRGASEAEGDDSSDAGTIGNDIIIASPDNDRLSGGAGSDLFVFEARFGRDVITDFEAGTGTDDVIQFSTTLFADFAAVRDSSMQVGSDIVIIAGSGDTVTLKNVALSKLHADDFVFV